MIEVDLFPSRHPLWQTYLEAPPEGVKYLVRSGIKGTAYLALSSFLRIKRLAHFCNGVKLAPGRKWVADMESVKVFFRSYEELENREKIESAVDRVMTGECIALLPLTMAAKRTIERYLDLRDVEIRVVYPTFCSQGEIRHSEVRDIVLFVGGSWRNLSFEAKGGREVCDAWLEIHRNFPDYRFVVLSDPPPSYVARLKEVNATIGAVPRKTLLTEIYPRTRVIVLPSMMDTVGYSVIEAMNYGAVPVVSDHFAMPELVGDAGIILKAPTGLWKSDGSHNPRFHEELSEGPFQELTESIADSLHMLLSDDSNWQNLSEKARRRMRSPPFSVESRNESILEVYQKAIQ